MAKQKSEAAGEAICVSVSEPRDGLTPNGEFVAMFDRDGQSFCVTGNFGSYSPGRRYAMREIEGAETRPAGPFESAMVPREITPPDRP